MDTKDVEKYLENIDKPLPPKPPEHDSLKIALMNSKRSSRAGLLLIALPFLIIFIFFLQNLLNLPPELTNWIDRATSSFPGYSRAIFFFLLLTGFPFLAIIINMLSITYFQYSKAKKEFNIIIKIRWWNITITLIAAAIASFYIFHLLSDTIIGGK